MPRRYLADEPPIGGYHMRKLLVVVVVVVLASSLTSACSEGPVVAPRTAAAANPGSIAGAVVSALPTCTRRWALPVDGAWGDPSMWIPFGIPSVSDTVCLNALGTFTATLGGGVSIGALRIGGTGSTATLRFDLGGAALAPLFVNSTLDVATGSRLLMRGCGGLLLMPSANVTIDGTLSVDVSCSSLTTAVIQSDNLTINGAVDFHGPAQVVLRNDLVNAGDITLFNGVRVNIGLSQRSVARLDAGSIDGVGDLLLVGTTAQGDTSRVRWRGGALAARSDDANTPVLTIQQANLTLLNSALSGFLQMRAVGPTLGGIGSSVDGIVGSNVRLRLDAWNTSTITLASITGGPFTNRGTIELTGEGTGIPPAIDAPGRIEAPGGLTNRGTLRVHDGWIELAADTLGNHGTIQLDTTARFTGNGNVLRNVGSAIVAAGHVLQMLPGTIFRSGPAATMAGTLSLDDATLTGVGTVGDVVSLSATVAPGDSIGTLRVSSLTMDPRSRLHIEVAGTTPGSFDVLDVAGNVSFGGAMLDVATLAPFQGGVCGQVVPIVRDHSTVSRGTFGKTNGLNPGPIATWRLYTPTDTLSLVGYNRVVPIFTTPQQLAVGEGGARASYATCLRSQPTAPVNIAMTLSSAQLALGGAPAVFTPTDWSLPRFVNVTAIDDAVIEPPQTDVISHTVTSSDPSYNNQPVGSVTVDVTDNDGSADLALAITQAPPAGLVVGQQFDVVFRVTNIGPTLSTGSTFTVPPIGGVGYLSAAGATCTRNSMGLTCSLQGVASGGTIAFTITAQATAVGTWAIPMSLVGHQADPNAGNNALVKSVIVN